MDETIGKQRGYLREDYRLFHLTGGLSREVENHYHEFHKLVFFREGRATYAIEGRLSDLQDRDVVIVPMGCVHRVMAEPGAAYDRVILYISPEFLRRHTLPDADPERCFTLCAERGRHVLRVAAAPEREQLWRLMYTLEQSVNDGEYGAKLLADCLLCELLLRLARQMLREADSLTVPRVIDSKAVGILHYINEHLFEDISIDSLAEQFFTSKYHMMRSFRSETGYTIHGYLSDKRLLAARELIAGGRNASEACYACGYRDYSAFSRAFKKKFGVSPRGGRSDGKEL